MGTIQGTSSTTNWVEHFGHTIHTNKSSMYYCTTHCWVASANSPIMHALIWLFLKKWMTRRVRNHQPPLPNHHPHHHYHLRITIIIIMINTTNIYLRGAQAKTKLLGSILLLCDCDAISLGPSCICSDQKHANMYMTPNDTKASCSHPRKKDVGVSGCLN